ncbi:hypothetical protein LT336_00357 [Spiroplasma sp. JKS002671]|uniref:hypothetical protein n=1 Tax=Spiroplasma attinicola TaxID=2904537 RepID=UPI002022A745|nr:hypothetical protein [Spiroplasma sp. JKS002671]MCL8210613.1 hypothetical protein [Spiroplasma sp. JKS002671]
MIKTRISLQSILLASYLLLIFAMIFNVTFDLIDWQKNEILPASICLIIFIICFISGIFNVFYCKKINKKLVWTFMFYLFLPFSVPLIILETKYKVKINNENDLQQVKQSDFIWKFLIITTILQVVSLFLIISGVIIFFQVNASDLNLIGWFFLIIVILMLIGLASSWAYFLTNKKVFKIMMIFNLQFGWPLFFLNFIITNNNRENKNNIELKRLEN